MILVDYSTVCIAALFSTGLDASGEVDEGIMRHVILNTLRSYNRKFRDEYGQIVLAMDAGNNWRKQIFPQYKANRKKSRDDSAHDWDTIFDCLNKVSKEIRAFVPWAGIKIDECEADDIIAVLAKDYHKREKILIISGDKDFAQLEQYPNVRRWSPRKLEFITEKDPKRYIFDHLIKGDAGDGVPNIHMDNAALVDGRRQKPVFAKKLDQWYSEGLDELTEEQMKNYERNRSVIEFESMPERIQEKIRTAWKELKIAKGDQLMTYLIEKKCNTLIEALPDFTPKVGQHTNTLF